MSGTIAIACTTYRESVRTKTLYVTLFFAAALVLTAALFGSVTIGDQVRVVKDFGLCALSLFPVSYAIIAGSALLQKELAHKTIYNILARPVHRSEFVAGKFLGMLATASMMLMIMGVLLSLFLLCLEGSFDLLMLQAYFYAWLEAVVVCAAAMFFSALVVTPMLSGLFTFGLFLAGRSTSYLLYFVHEGGVTRIGSTLFKGIYWCLPHLDEINIANDIVYGRSMGIEYAAYAALYVGGYAAILLILAQVMFSRREFN